MSEDNYDDFGDIIQHDAGIFGLDTPAMNNALHTHDSAKTVPLADGVHVTMHCPYCGRTRDVTVSWPEISCLSVNINPSKAIEGMTNWVFTAQGWTPTDLRCGGCDAHPELHPYLSQQEAAGHARTGASHGWPHFRVRQGPQGMMPSAHDYITKKLTGQIR